MRHELTSSVRATLSHSLRTEPTPCAVLISMGQMEQMKMTNTPEADAVSYTHLTLPTNREV